MAKLSDKQRQMAKDLMYVGGAVQAASGIYKAGKKFVKGVKEKVKKHKDKKEFMNEEGTKWKETDTTGYEAQKAEFLDDGKIVLHGVSDDGSHEALNIDVDARGSLTSLRGIFDFMFIISSLLVIGLMTWNVGDAISKGEIF